MPKTSDHRTLVMARRPWELQKPMDCQYVSITSGSDAPFPWRGLHVSLMRFILSATEEAER